MNVRWRLCIGALGGLVSVYTELLPHSSMAKLRTHHLLVRVGGEVEIDRQMDETDTRRETVCVSHTFTVHNRIS